MSDVPRVVHFSLAEEAQWEPNPEGGADEWVFYRSSDGRRIGAAWRNPGDHTFTYPFDEFVYVVSGSSKVRVQDGESFDLKAGDVAFFEKGATVEFEMTDDFCDVTCLVSEEEEVKWR
jgi:uncharacterized cupin superfamily protein